MCITGYSGHLPASASDNSFFTVGRDMLFTQFRATVSLAGYQSLVWRVHSDLSGGKRHTTEAKDLYDPSHVDGNGICCMACNVSNVGECTSAWHRTGCDDPSSMDEDLSAGGKEGRIAQRTPLA